MAAGANFYIVGRDPAGMPHPDKLVSLLKLLGFAILDSQNLRLVGTCMNQLMEEKCSEWPQGCLSSRSFPSGDLQNLLHA